MANSGELMDIENEYSDVERAMNVLSDNDDFDNEDLAYPSNHRLR